MKYIEKWNSETQKYEWKEYTRKDWVLDKLLKDKTCEFCDNTATGYTRSGGLRVFHCSQCIKKLGQDKINSRFL